MLFSGKYMAIFAIIIDDLTFSHNYPRFLGKIYLFITQNLKFDPATDNV